MKKKTLLDKTVLCIFPLVGTVFLVTLFAIFWSFIIENKYLILSISGGIIIIFALLGYFNKAKFFRGIRRKLK